jgi:3-methyladenine DNA glycosylase Tag
MRDFAEIEAIAVGRKGPGLLDRLIQPVAVEELAAKPLSDWLEAMAKAIFQAGFSWSVIDAKWPGFQAAFAGFDPGKLSLWHEDDMDRLLADPGIVRNGAKIAAVLENAVFLTALQAETCDAAGHLAHWPGSDQAGFLAMLGKRGARLGGNTGQRVCRMVGRDSWVLSEDVVKRLVLEGVIDGPPTSAKAMGRVQAAFNHWRDQSGRTLAQISQVLAQSVE